MATKSLRPRVKTDTKSVDKVTKLNEDSALVSTSFGLTLNLGDFNSARFDVSVQRHCGSSTKEIEAELKDLQTIAFEEVYRQVELIESELDD